MQGQNTKERAQKKTMSRKLLRLMVESVQRHDAAEEVLSSRFSSFAPQQLASHCAGLLLLKPSSFLEPVYAIVLQGIR